MQYRGKRNEIKMTAHESGRGWAFFVVFTMVFPFLMGLIQRYIDGLIPVAEANVLYYLCAACVILIIFWQYLRESFSFLLDHFGENLLAVLIGLAIDIPLHILVMKLPYPVENPNTFTYPEQFTLSSSATVAILLVFIPLLEEVLFRGLLFGSLRAYSRPLAWIAATVVYCFYCVWQFAFTPAGATDLRYLMLGIQYLPSALALTWCYERGGSIWSSVLLHMGINAIFLFSTLSAYTTL